MNNYKPQDKIDALVRLKNYLDMFITDRNRPVIEYLKAQPVKRSDDDELTIDMIAKALQMKSAKVGSIIRELYPACILSFEERQVLKVRSLEVFISICGRANERKEQVAAGRKVDYSRALQFSVDLPVLPRLGERIEIGSLVDNNLKDNYGVVHEISHWLSEDVQSIGIYVDPDENFYFHWRQLKFATEEKDAWWQRMKAISEMYDEREKAKKP